MIESIMVAVNENHPLTAKPAILLKELAGQPLILFPSGIRPSFIDKIWDLCAAEGFEPQVAQEVGDAPTSVALVAGFGLSLVPEAASSLSVPGVVYRRLEVPPDLVPRAF
jgi:DNA-binding transcriptional LysR family regulator